MGGPWRLPDHGGHSSSSQPAYIQGSGEGLRMSTLPGACHQQNHSLVEPPQKILRQICPCHSRQLKLAGMSSGSPPSPPGNHQVSTLADSRLPPTLQPPLSQPQQAWGSVKRSSRGAPRTISCFRSEPHASPAPHLTGCQDMGPHLQDTGAPARRFPSLPPAPS